MTNSVRIWLLTMIIGIAACLAVLANSLPAKAQGSQAFCTTIHDMEAILIREFNETPTEVFGSLNDQVVMMVYASPGGKTWTALFVRADGLACVLAMGVDWMGGWTVEEDDGV